MIWVASVITIVCIIFSLFFAVCGLISIFVFLTVGRTMKTRKVIIVMQGFCSLAISCAFFFLTMVGGSIQNHVFLTGLLGSDIAEGSYSYSWGVTILLICIVWSYTLPCWTMCAAKRRYCKDCYNEDEDDTEKANLILKEGYGKQVKTKDIIDYYAR